MFGSNKPKTYYIYFMIGPREIGEYSDAIIDSLKLDDLTLEQAQIKLNEIKKKIENNVVEVIDNEILNWQNISCCYIQKN